MSDSVYAICPYNKNHRVLRLRMPGHMLKCQKDYSGPEFDQCIYNAQHLVPKGSMEEHLRDCAAHHSFFNAEYAREAQKLRR